MPLPVPITDLSLVVLQDQSVINDYKIEDGHTIHMVARPPDYDELRHQISQREQEQQNSTSTATTSARDSLQSLFALSSLLGGGGGNTDQSANSNLARSGDRTEPEISTSLEPIRQSLLTIHTLLSTMNTTAGTAASTRTTAERTDAPEMSISNPRKYFVGQWLDVKDTVNQWLEATIMQVDLEQSRIFVHYNGW
jgi:hypothetical protein